VCGGGWEAAGAGLSRAAGRVGGWWLLAAWGCVSLALPTGMRVTVASPFEGPGACYRVGVSGEGRYGLWPATRLAAGGWTVAHGVDSGGGCLEFAGEGWAGVRPGGLFGVQGG
jgi:uncharacterized protein YbdZ (MbtH family)